MHEILQLLPMADAPAAPKPDTTKSDTISSILFGIVVAITLYITFMASKQNKTAADFYAAGRGFTGFQNGLAVSGDYMSAASFLGISGLIASKGYDGFLYSIGFLVAWLVALLLVAEFIRNSGRFTMADVLAFRMRQGPVRTAAATSTVVVSIFYLLAQMVGAGALVSLLIHATSNTAQNLTIVVVGILMIVYVTVGGMRGTTYVQIVKACLLMAGTTLIVFLTLKDYGFSLSNMMGHANENAQTFADTAKNKANAAAGKPPLAPGEHAPLEYLGPGGNYGKNGTTKLDFISLSIALVLGTAGLPHILTRFYTVPTAKTARKSVLWAIGIIGTFYLMTLVLGFGAGAEIKSHVFGAGNNNASPLLAQEVGGGEGSTGGAILLALIAAVAFATILAVVAGLTLTSSASFAHDLYANVIRKGQATEQEEVRVARFAAGGIGAISILLSMAAKDQNIAFLVAVAFALAASANLPTILFSLFWKRFNTRGAVWGIYGGLVTTLTLIIFSPSVSGTPTSLFKCDLKEGVTPAACVNPDPYQMWAHFHLNNPAIISVPAGFLFAIIGTLTAREKRAEEKFIELEVRALTGAGAEKAIKH
jgi:cation/acetate symporter